MSLILRLFLAVVALTAFTGPVRAQNARDNPAAAATSAATPVDRLVLCIDVSGSMGPSMLAEIKRGILTAWFGPGNAAPALDVAIIAFGNQILVPLEFTHQRDQIENTVRGLAINPGGRSRLLDAVAVSLTHLRSAGPGTKRVIVISDGLDDGSSATVERLLELTNGAPSIAIDAVAIGQGGVLSTLASRSGGRFSAADQAHVGNAVAGMLQPPSAAAPVVVPTTPGVALHVVKVRVHATTESKCLQLAFGVAADSLQDVHATTSEVNGRLGGANLSISCVAVGGQDAIAVVTAAAGTSQDSTQAAEQIAAKVSAAAN